MAELLLEDLSPGSLEYEKVKVILKAGKRGGDLTKQILAFSRQSENKKMPVRMQQILKEVLNLSRATISSNIEIHSDIQSDCGMVMADPTQVHQIAMNLITNAYHAIEEAGNMISVLLKETELERDDLVGKFLEPGRYAMLTVLDNGHGIDPSVMDRIFEPYFTTKANGKGTGLGLSVVHGIVKEHGGDICVYSEMGKGTAFHVYLPLLNRSTEPEKAEKPVIHETGTESVLLVDDEEPIVRLEQMMLERLGYKVTARTSSVEALGAFRSDPNKFDIVITDMNMPNLTGNRLAREIGVIKPGVPVIMCTGFSEKIDEKSAKANGISGFLMKPVVKSDMAKMVRKVLDEAKG
jgi:CheY-like chemotaxis protein